jgi:hypothetical protein
VFDLPRIVQTRLAGLLAGQSFDDPDGGVRALRTFVLGLPAKRETAAQGQDYPFAVIRLLGGDETLLDGKLRVRIIGGLWVNPAAGEDLDGDGTVEGAADGDDGRLARAERDVGRLLTAIRALGADGNYSPYSLEAMKWWLGDEDGQQPEPDLYYITADLVFTQEPVFTNY